MLKKLIELFIKTNGRNPNTLEMLQLKFKAARLSGKGKVIEFPKDRITDWTKSRPSLTKVKTSKDKIDWLVKNVDPNAEQTIPPKETLEAMLRDGREDLIDHFFEMHTKKLSGKPKINIDTSGLKHPELVKKIITDKKLKPNLVKTEPQIKSGIEAGNKAGIQKMIVDKLRKDVLKEIENRKNQDYIGNIIDPEDYGFKVSDGTLTDEVEEIMQMLMRDNKAGGGIAGMLGEPTFQDEDHRIPLKKGKTPGEVLDPDWDAENPEHMNLILKLLLAGEIPKFADGGRIGFKLGGIDKARRAFLKMMGAGAAGVGAAKSGLLSIFKGSKSAAVKDLTQVPIQNAEGMPSWFKPLVNRVIKEGTDITKLPPNKGGAYLDRQIVHEINLDKGYNLKDFSNVLGETTKLRLAKEKIGTQDIKKLLKSDLAEEKKQVIRVYQNLDDQTINVEYKSADNMGGVDDAVYLEYTAPQVIEPPVVKGGKLSGYGKGVKTKP